MLHRRLLSLLFIFFFSILTPFATASETAKRDHIKVSWLAPEQFGPNSEEVGILFEIEPQWHIYWRNPGDSGTAPKFKFTFKGAEASDLQWPAPKRLPFGELTNLGYEKAIAFPFRVTPTADSVEIAVALEWLVCKEECIPGFATLTLKRPRGAAVKWDAKKQESLEGFSDRVPNFAGPWKITNVKLSATDLRVTISGIEDSVPDIFPLDGNFLLPTLPKLETARGSELTYIIPIVKGYPTPKETGFVFEYLGRAKEISGVRILSATSSETMSQTESSLVALLAFAFLGGVLLNLMPCVFPVLSIKLFSLMRPGVSSRERLREGLLYSAGVMVTFTGLGAALLIARSLGAQAGWGFQLQSPTIVLLLVALFWLMGLNFLGVFEMGNSIVAKAGKLYPKAGQSKWLESFATGALSVFVAAPCTGPFMGSALGATATLPAIQALLIFVVLGAGLAFPFLLLAMSPRLMSYLPKPGAWMETLKQFLAFPLFATVLWLVWVLGMQIGDNGWVAGGCLVLFLSFAIWLGGSRKSFIRNLSWLIGAVALAVSIQSVRKTERTAVAQIDAASSWAAYDRAKIDAEIAKGRAVFIDFTAAWCITCQVNKKTVLETEAGEKIFKDNDVYLVKADWTNQNPEITKALAEFGRNSVPLYLFYGKNQTKPTVLPQILTMPMIRNLFTDETTKEN